MQTEKFDLDSVSPTELLKLVKKEGGQRAFARKYGLARTNLQTRLYKMRKEPFAHRPAPKAKRVGDKRGVRRFLLTSAQDSTLLHEGFLTNLEAYRDFLQKSGSCEIMIGGFTYNKSLFEDHDKKAANLYPERIRPYLVSERIRIADKIDFCGEMNTLPTAENPLSGFHTYTRDRWGVFPHAKQQLVSVPTMKYAPPKQIMTTGAVTKPNYVPKKAGIKASFHHIYGAVLVEIDAEGDFFCRHISADEDGTFEDVHGLVTDGVVYPAQNLKSLTPGDIHTRQIDPVVAATVLGASPDEDGKWQVADEPSMIDILQPEYLFWHDTLDFRTRNHHSIADPHDRFRLFTIGVDCVEDEYEECAYLLDYVQGRYPDTQCVVVDSNHDQAGMRWLRSADYRLDPANARFFLECQLAVYRAIETGDDEFSLFEHICKNHFSFEAIQKVRFLREDESFVIDEVENSNHGHRGPNGARGSVASLKRVAPKMTIGHVHSPAMQDALCAAGTSSKLDMGYNKGPSSWAHTLVGQYQNGKRTLITISSGKWCVPV